MISPRSELKLIGQSVKLFNISYSAEERAAINQINDELDELFPEMMFDLHFFKDGMTLYGEAVVDSGDDIKVVRVMGDNLLDVAFDLQEKIIRSTHKLTLVRNYQ